jgi:2'-5' RNA ligase
MDFRCFVAVELPDALKDLIGKGTEHLRSRGGKVRWTPARNFHLTLKFLGETPESMLPDIEARLGEAVKGHGAFSVRFRGVGVFPDPRRPRVIWIGVENPEPLQRLQAGVEEALVSLGFEDEGRPYNPHLTLGRVKDPRGAGPLMGALREMEQADFGQMRVQGVSLVRSDLGPGGSRYTRLFRVALEGGEPLGENGAYAL